MSAEQSHPTEEETKPAPQPEDPHGGVLRTRTSAAFKSVLAGVVVLVLLLVFILENTKRVAISYFGARGHMPLGVALLLAAVAGALLVGVLGAARIVQLRRGARRAKRRQ
jgi:uncharacterized integral membrane protein